MLSGEGGQWPMEKTRTYTWKSLLFEIKCTTQGSFQMRFFSYLDQMIIVQNFNLRKRKFIKDKENSN